VKVISHAKHQDKIFTFADRDYRDAWTAARGNALRISPKQADAYISEWLLDQRRPTGDEQESGIVFVWE